MPSKDSRKKTPLSQIHTHALLFSLSMSGVKLSMSLNYLFTFWNWMRWCRRRKKKLIICAKLNWHTVNISLRLPWNYTCHGTFPYSSTYRHIFVWLKIHDALVFSSIRPSCYQAHHLECHLNSWMKINLIKSITENKIKQKKKENENKIVWQIQNLVMDGGKTYIEPLNKVK